MAGVAAAEVVGAVGAGVAAAVSAAGVVVVAVAAGVVEAAASVVEVLVDCVPVEAVPVAVVPAAVVSVAAALVVGVLASEAAVALPAAVAFGWCFRCLMSCWRGCWTGRAFQLSVSAGRTVRHHLIRCHRRLPGTASSAAPAGGRGDGVQRMQGASQRVYGAYWERQSWMKMEGRCVWT